jgi:SanA protein
MAQEGFDRGFGGGQTRHGVDVQTRPDAIKARGVRLILFALFLLGAMALAATLLAWLAERRLDRMAEAWSASDAAKLPAVDVALVLGTAPIGPEGGPNRYFVHRLDAAASLWKAGKVKYLIVSGSDPEPAAMRAGLIERGVPAEAIYRDSSGYRTWDSMLRARDVYGQKRMVIVSQRFHLDRALFIARSQGIEAWGLEARDVDTPYSIFTELRRYPSALRAYYDVWTDAKAREGGKKVAIGVDPPS